MSGIFFYRERERESHEKKRKEAHLSLGCMYARLCLVEFVHAKRKENDNKKRVTRESESLDILVHFLIIVVDL